MELSLLDRIRGCIIGGAVGDALGYPVAGMSWNEIKTKYGEGGITGYTYKGESEEIDFSALTQLMLFTATGILVGETRKHERMQQISPVEMIRIAYRDWYQTQRYQYMEFHVMVGATEANKDGYKPVSWLCNWREFFAKRGAQAEWVNAAKCKQKLAFDYRINEANDAGCLTRVAPLALHYIRQEVGALDLLGAEVAALLHGAPMAFVCAAAMTHLLTRIVEPKHLHPTLKDIFLEAVYAAGRLFPQYAGQNAKLKKLVGQAIWMATEQRDERKAIHELIGNSQAENILAVAAFCCLRYQHDFSTAILTAANHGGDSAGAAAVTGQILGVWQGIDAIDERWQKPLLQREMLESIALDLSRDLQDPGVRAKMNWNTWDKRYAK